MASPKLLSRELGAVELILLSKLDGSEGIVLASNSAIESASGAVFFPCDAVSVTCLVVCESAAMLDCVSLLLADASAAREDRITVSR